MPIKARELWDKKAEKQGSLMEYTANEDAGHGSNKISEQTRAVKMVTKIIDSKTPCLFSKCTRRLFTTGADGEEKKSRIATKRVLLKDTYTTRRVGRTTPPQRVRTV